MKRIQFKTSEITCKTCGNVFTSRKNCSTRTPKFCSSACFSKSISKPKTCTICGSIYVNSKNKSFCSNECKSKSMIGKKFSISHRKAISKSKSGVLLADKHQNWKGDTVGYNALHEWVYRQLGSPMKCSCCGSEKNTNREIHWSNKSGEYKRDPSDWERLCVSCHKKKDLCRIKETRNENN